MKAALLQVRGGVMRDRYGKQAGKGALVKWEHAPCINATQDTTLFVLGVFDMMGGKAGCHHSEGGCSPTITSGRGSCSDVHSLVLGNKPLN